jgi:hypothetical protein
MMARGAWVAYAAGGQVLLVPSERLCRHRLALRQQHSISELRQFVCSARSSIWRRSRPVRPTARWHVKHPCRDGLRAQCAALLSHKETPGPAQKPAPHSNVRALICIDLPLCT